MAKLIYEAVVQIVVDTGAVDEDRDMIEGAIAEQLCELHDIDEGTVVTTDLKLTLKDAK